MALIRALARAHWWKWLLEEGGYGSTAEIAEAKKIGRSFVSRLLRLRLLAPDIQEAIQEGRQAKGMQLEELTRAMPQKQRVRKQHIPAPVVEDDNSKERYASGHELKAQGGTDLAA